MKEDSLHSQRQDRLTSHSVNRTRLPRPGAPSSILVSYRLSLAAHPVVTREVSARLRVLRTVPASPRPRACERDRQGIIGCPVNRWTMQHNTESGRTRELSYLCARSNPLNPRAKSEISRAGSRHLRRIASTCRCFRPGDVAPTTRDTEPEAPSQPAGGASRRSRWPAVRLQTVRKPLARSTHRFGSESSRGCEGSSASFEGGEISSLSPGSLSPGHLVSPSRARRTSEQRATCLRWAGDLHVRLGGVPCGTLVPR
jgi:hypothetical protein